MHLPGGVANGSIAVAGGRNFWNGEVIQAGRGSFSFNNAPLDIQKNISDIKSLNNYQTSNSTSTSSPTELYHYTSQKGYEGISKSQKILPSLNPKHARFGEGQYFTDLKPSDYTAGQVSRRLYGIPWNVRKVQYFFKIDVSGLNVIQNAPHNFIIPGRDALNIGNRITGSGLSPFKPKY